ncbi:MAG TPA: CdaR family protein [Thermoanaerobaculia bacterium]|jgi:YbbR domain-containing protein|nr:CdaR family protein [Thermoanaerobaculia bacterium]
MGLFRNLGLKLIALFLALVVWFFTSAPRREAVSERAFSAPLSFIRMPRELVITTQLPDSVNVRLRGRVSDLRSVSSQNMEVTVDLSQSQPGETTITLLPQAINVPPEVEVVSMEPNKIRFRVEQLRQRAVPIRPFLVGEPPLGYTAGEPTVAPAEALVSGPASQIRNLAEVATERIIMTGRTEAFTQSVAVVSDSPLVRVIEPVNVQVTVPVLAQVPVGPQPPTDTGEQEPTKP